MSLDSVDADVIVIGGGIAGLGAALRLKDHGLEPLLLEAEGRVGGRMTTDRTNGFVIDRGVTLFGNGFRSMRALVKRLGLSSLTCPGQFSVAIQDAKGVRGYRGGRFDDLLLERGFSWAARIAALRLGFDLIRNYRALRHGHTTLSARLDGEDCQGYFRRIGGEELFERIFWPGLNGPMGGAVEKSSRVILMQVLWNLLVRGQWNLTDGVDCIPEAAGSQVKVVTAARVIQVERIAEGVSVDAELGGQRRSLTARAAIFAVPGQLVPRLCPSLPEDLREVLGRTAYSSIANAAVALARAPRVPYAGYAFTPDVLPGAEIEMEHLRAPHRCPPGKAMAGVFLWDTPQKRRLQSDDEELRRQASEIVERAFPECQGKVLFVHLVRWKIAIAQFPPGRVEEMTAVRKRLAAWKEPFDLCGDFLDGISSESALYTGQQAAERVAERLITT